MTQVSLKKVDLAVVQQCADTIRQIRNHPSVTVGDLQRAVDQSLLLIESLSDVVAAFEKLVGEVASGEV